MSAAQDLAPFEGEGLILGVIYRDRHRLALALRELCAIYGELALCSDTISFSREFSHYYDRELGGEGLRQYFAFARPVAPDTLAHIKQRTNAIEESLAVEGQRTVNLDPGLLNDGRLLLATTKKAPFRIALTDGIYAEMTLFYARGQWQCLPWTYQDYRTPLAQDFLSMARARWLAARRQSADGGAKTRKKQR